MERVIKGRFAYFGRNAMNSFVIFAALVLAIGFGLLDFLIQTG